LDSIYGPDNVENKSICIRIRLLHDLDPDVGFSRAAKNTIQIAILTFDNVKVGMRLNNAIDAAKNDAFSLVQQDIKTTTTVDGKDVVTRVAPIK
jgi:hypothetical protein